MKISIPVPAKIRFFFNNSRKHKEEQNDLSMGFENEFLKAYHDEEWCRPHHDDTYLFEMLILEGAQAGLSWSTI